MFTSNIKEIMKRKKVTIRELAAVSGVSAVSINKARSDSGISECRLSTLGRIANALEVRTKRLFDEMEGPPAGEGPAGGE
ncbi:MAG: helix-turn-helix transcriptional regulator [Desulfovibrionaceae bacterium]|nr:helix-turn-helix transcriptional regulator [Desulfovibrionaceae bacterium]